MTHAIQCRCYGKINLYLDVVRKRADGFHDIETVFQSVSLYDDLLLTRAETLRLSCDVPAIPVDASNLALKAAALLRNETGCALGADIQLTKRIPVAGGMAGGSANAAAALVGLNALWNLGLSNAKLAHLALQLGSDVSFCLTGGSQAATGRGDILMPVSVTGMDWFVLALPGIQISAGSIYGDPLLPIKSAPQTAATTPEFQKVLERFSKTHGHDAIYNAMEAPVFARHPELAVIKQSLLDAGCVAAALSGSGSTLFGVCRSEAKARRAAKRVTSCETQVVQAVSKGVLCGEGTV